MMAQAGAPKLKLRRSKGKRCKHHTLSFFYILCAIGKLKKSQFRFSEPEARKFKANCLAVTEQLRGLARTSMC